VARRIETIPAILAFWQRDFKLGLLEYISNHLMKAKIQLGNNCERWLKPSTLPAFAYYSNYQKKYHSSGILPKRVVKTTLPRQNRRSCAHSCLEELTRQSYGLLGAEVVVVVVVLAPGAGVAPVVVAGVSVVVVEVDVEVAAGGAGVSEDPPQAVKEATNARLAAARARF
jgi:hypothetical protein